MTPREKLLERLEGVREGYGGSMALCPAHDDQEPSLSVSEGDDGRVLVHCFAGCSTEDVVKAVGLELSDLFPEGRIPVSKPTERVEFYIYRDAEGNPLYKIKRTRSKEFYPYVYKDGDFKRKAGWFGVDPIPYRLDELADRVFWVEGEKDADRLSSLGLAATTSPGGTNAFKPRYSEYLRGREVVIIPDNDPPGAEYGRAVAEALAGVASRVQWLELPGLPEKGDASDFFDLGGTKEAFLEYAERAPDFAQFQERFTGEDEGSREPPKLELLSMGTDREIPEQEYIVDGILPVGHPSMVYGDGGVGKSVLCLSMACAVTAGLPDWLGFALKQTSVVYLDYEMPFEEQVRRARKIARGLGLEKPPDNLYYLMGTPENSWQDIKETCLHSEVGLLIVDSFGPALAGDMEASNDIIAYIRDFVRPLLGHDITVLFIDHQPKAQGASYQDQTAFGSVYKRNLVRSQLQVEGRQDEEEAGKYQVIFRHKKHNFGPKLPPFGAELVFGEDDIRLRSVVIDTETLMKEKDLKVEDRVLLALYREDDGLTRQDIAERIISSAGTVANALTGLRRRDLVSETDLKQGRQSTYVLMKKGETRVELDLTGIPSVNGWQDGGKGFIDG